MHRKFQSIFLFLGSLSLGSIAESVELDVQAFLQKHAGPIYQDVNIRNEVVVLGTDQCSVRYDLIKPILNSYEGKFSVLDLGAAQGFFSFSIANDYPKSFCVMIDANTSYYGYHGNLLYDICLLNKDLNNFSYLNRAITLSDLRFLNKQEHFDVIIAFLVVHLMDDTLQAQIKIIETLLSLGDNVLLEVASDVGVPLSSYVEFLSTKLDCEYIGEVQRHKDLSCPRGNVPCCCTGQIFWFKSKNGNSDTEMKEPTLGMKKETFQQLNGVYPPSAN
ncbi:MAG: hypothetical protein JSR76_07720 [Verrucomicrobia bacterium]|nr:hypothetical protein [Verrucomicrobiota bacterium]